MCSQRSSTTFAITLRRTTLIEFSLAEAITTHQTPSVGELDACGFSVSRPETDTEYQVTVGDEAPDQALGRHFGHEVLWEHAAYFESARGRVWVHLLSRPMESDDVWQHRAQVLINVLPTKLGEERYEAMFEDLRAVSVGLVFDLLSKSRLKLSLSGVGCISSRPASADLMVLERLWSSVSYTLQQIAVQPMAGLRLVRERRLCWGSERLGRISLRELTSAGIDPRRSNAPRPFSAVRERVAETFDVPEHRIILGFLKFLRQRVSDCEVRAEKHVAGIERERPFRDIEQPDGSNLFRDFDWPKIERLRVAGRKAGELGDRIRSAEQLGFLRGLRGELRVPQSPIFANVLPYRRFRDEMLRYLNASVAILDEGIEERAKSTSRMYEQWVFLQLIAALRACGLSPIGQEGLLTRWTRDRFTIDLERGTRVSFGCPDGRILNVRYEPWIHPSSLARSLHDTVYRGRSGENSWRPDMLIEVMADSDDRTQPLRVDYAVVVDAKYTVRITARHQDEVRKYSEIRRTADDRPVVKQVWLAHPSNCGIVPWDQAVEWNALGPNRPPDESVNGTLGVLPPPTPGAPATKINDTLLDFAGGLLAYLGTGIHHSRDPHPKL
jgi:hypothetical protein